MAGILIFILQFLVLGVVIFGVFTLLRKFVFSKVKINKWIPLAIAIVLFIIQFFVQRINVYAGLALTVFVLIFFMWFLDVHQGIGPSGKPKGKQIEIRSKAKPNRAKQFYKDKEDKK